MSWSGLERQSPGTKAEEDLVACDHKADGQMEEVEGLKEKENGIEASEGGLMSICV